MEQQPGPADAFVLVRRDNGVLSITLNRPAVKNALTWEAWSQLRAALESVDPLEDRVVVVTGSGTDFCSGADLGDPLTGARLVDDMRVVSDTCLALHRLPVPTIARVDGVAVGAGMNVALACDFVVASNRARFSEIFVQRALSVDSGGSWFLPRIVGLRRARELVLLGEIVGAQEAFDMGILHQVVEAEELDDAVAALSERLASGPRLAMAGSKALLNATFEVTLERALDEEARAQAASASSEDAAEAFEAFAQKRRPNFRSDGSGRREGAR